MRDKGKLSRLFALLLLLTSVADNTRAQQQPDVDADDAVTSCSAPVMVVGEVAYPGRFELHKPTRLNEIIDMAAGLTSRAKETVQIIHTEPASGCESLVPGDSSKPIANDESFTGIENYKLADFLQGDDEANPYIRPGDIVVVNHVSHVEVVGSVASPHQIELNEPLTVSLAIAMAGGLSPDARGGKIVIYRRNVWPREIITADLNAITKRQAADIVLQPNDIVEALGSKPSANPFNFSACTLP